VGLKRRVQHDLDVVRDLGMNCNPVLHAMAGLRARARQLRGTPCSRGSAVHQVVRGARPAGASFAGHRRDERRTFWPKGKEGRNLFSDPSLIIRSAAYCRKAAAVLAPYHDHLLAIDLGNELSVADAWASPPAAIRPLCDAVTKAIAPCLIPRADRQRAGQRAGERRRRLAARRTARHGFLQRAPLLNPVPAWTWPRSTA